MNEVINNLWENKMHYFIRYYLCLFSLTLQYIFMYCTQPDMVIKINHFKEANINISISGQVLDTFNFLGSVFITILRSYKKVMALFFLT
jgi:hypothetical protein